LEILIGNNWPITVQTRSPLVTRDADLLKAANDIEVGMTISTADDSIRQLFEPQAPSIKSRINALDELHRAGIRTFAMIAPLLPKADGLVNELEGKVDYLLIDRLNYHYSDWVYKNNDLENAMSDSFFSQKTIELAAVFKIKQIECRVLC
jgi:DNA repair photolyase